MGCDFCYYSKNADEILLEDGIEVLDKIPSVQFLVSNSKEVDSQIYAPEIDFYLRNSTDSALDKARNTTLLYEARAIYFDLAKDMDFSQDVGNNILIVSQNDEGLLEQKLEEENFISICLEPSKIEWIDGHLGALKVGIIQNDKSYELETDQIIWQNAPEFALMQSGVIDAKNNDEILKIACEKRGKHHYKNFINYNPNICQYHERREEICAKCEEVCPTVAITKDNDEKHLYFSHIDCHGCGGCVSVCPSGALDYSRMHRSSLSQIAKLYKDKIILIIPNKMDIETLNISLPKNVLPFAIDGEKFLHEGHFLTLLQESGASLIFYTDFVSKGSQDAICIVNQVYDIKFGKKAIYTCENKEELEFAFKEVGLIENSYFSLNESNLEKREASAKRLAFLVGQDNLGYIKSGEYVRYAKVFIDENKCTLCLSCAGACNTGALSINSKTNSLLFNASVCTACGYCEVSCAEKDCLSVERGKLELIPESFSPQVLVQDELFECIECKKPFATKKAVEKIANLMKPRFIGDEAKIKTLYCCADCKAKIMIKRQLEESQNLRGGL